MAKPFWLLVFVCALVCSIAQSQTVIQVNAGSRAPYGNYQNLLISADGKCSYQLAQVNGPVKDSAHFTISSAQVDSLFTKAEQVGFFQLNAKYDAGYADGSGVMIAMNHSGNKKTVQLLNTDIPQINDWVTLLNHMLLPQKSRIYYGQSLK